MPHYHPWRTALSGGAVYDFADLYDLGDTGIAASFGFHGSPHVDANGNDYRAQSPLTYALGVTCPVLLVHDVGDPHAPVSGAMRMYRTLRDNGKQVRFVAIPVDGHGPTDIVRRIDREQLWVDWAAEGLR
jgi:dipeptidyl aminopeptidase/acylaminoacyl peptidase